jgi:hypothetical protein
MRWDWERLCNIGGEHEGEVVLRENEDVIVDALSGIRFFGKM